MALSDKWVFLFHQVRSAVGSIVTNEVCGKYTMMKHTYHAKAAYGRPVDLPDGLFSSLVDVGQWAVELITVLSICSSLYTSGTQV